MGSNRSTNTQQEALMQMLGTIAETKTYPDADIEWLLGLETQILSKLREPVQQALSQSGIPSGQGQPSSPMAGGMPGGDMSAMMGGMPPGMGGGVPSGPPPGVPGLRQSPGAPNPDELRRLLTQGQ